jgi:hypothetical protein
MQSTGLPPTDPADPDAGRRTPAPRGPALRSLIAAVLFAATVIPGWTLGGLAERWTGWALLDWLITCGSSGVAVYVLGPRASYRRRDAILGMVPFLGWYLGCVLCWRVALQPYRDWEPRADELWRARWLTGDLIGYWRADPLPAPAERRGRSGRGYPGPRQDDTRRDGPRQDGSRGDNPRRDGRRTPVRDGRGRPGVRR